MFGATSYNITQVDGTLFTIFWDNVVSEPLFVSFTATSIDGVNQPNISAITAGLAQTFGVNQEININQIATLVQQIDPNTLVTVTPTTQGLNTAATGTFAPKLAPSSKNKEFTLSSADVIITPMILAPTTSSVAASGAIAFTGYGGYGTLTYSISVNNSGGSINSSTGAYIAGMTTGVTDTVLVTDSQSNTATASVTVIA